ncbi:MAG: HEPN domain-containing protein [Candidatus Omnitrophica bacterium]|nr:HEPN domain-containing protein [Candidatus Omnitrophota bacterium]
MSYDKFLKEYLSKGLLKEQKIAFSAVEKLILRCEKDLKTAKANLKIDEGIAYTVAYLAMLRAGRAYMLLKGFRPVDGYQHKTVVEFMAQCLGGEYKGITERFDRMRRKRNIFTYEIDVSITYTEAEGAFETAGKFVDLVKKVIKAENPQEHFKF